MRRKLCRSLPHSSGAVDLAKFGQLRPSDGCTQGKPGAAAPAVAVAGLGWMVRIGANHRHHKVAPSPQSTALGGDVARRSRIVLLTCFQTPGDHAMKRRNAIAAAGALALAGTRSAFSQSPITIKFSHVVTDDTPKGKGALKFKELAEKYTGGKVKVDIYPNSTLYKDKEEMDALNSGAVQMLAPSTAKFRPIGVPEFEAMDLPFVFPDDAEYQKTVKGPVGKGLLKKLEAKGITGLGFWDNGFHMVSSNDPLLMPADFQGKKFRISGSKIADRYFRLLGALPQIMAFSEVYQALQTGVVDGCENTPSNYYTQKFFEVQKHITVSRHAHLQYAVITNTKFWSGLPPAIRTQLEKAMDEATDYTNSIALDENKDALDKIKASGRTTLHYLTPEQRKAWFEKMKPIYAEAEDKIGKQIVQDLLNAAGLKV
jgi:C4-dicarboxylate-binding protein DctP